MRWKRARHCYLVSTDGRFTIRRRTDPGDAISRVEWSASDDATGDFTITYLLRSAKNWCEHQLQHARPVRLPGGF